MLQSVSGALPKDTSHTLVSCRCGRYQQCNELININYHGSFAQLLFLYIFFLSVNNACSTYYFLWFSCSHVVITKEHLYILRLTDEEHKYIVKSRRTMNSIMRITKKAKMPDCIKLEYGSRDKHDVHITDTDKLNIPRRAGKLYFTGHGQV